MTQVLDMPTRSSGDTYAVAKPRQTVMGSLAERYSMDPTKLLQVLKATCIKGNATDEQVQAFCLVANRYGLDPFLKEIHAFAGQGGGIVPIVGIDGWTKIANGTNAMDGCEFAFDGEGRSMTCTCTIYVKGRAHPTRVTEYMAECGRESQPWRQWPRRMLRHKAFMQCARIAFGLGGIYDEDEAREIIVSDSAAAPAANPVNPVGSRAAALAARVAPADRSQSPVPLPSEAEASRIIEEKARQAQQAQLANEPADAPASTPATEPVEAEGVEDKAVPSAENLTDYQTFLELCESEAAARNVDPEQFDRTMAALNVSTAVRSPKRSHNLAARQQVLFAIRSGNVDWSEGKLK
jgi:phage recombination protein Bet